METPQGRESFSSAQKPTNPALFFAEWSSTKKHFEFYDKVSKTNVALPLPFAFLPVWEMVCVKGYNHKEGKSYWSNEVKNIVTDKFTVMSKNNATKEIKTEFVGLYSDIKNLIDGRANYTKSIYIGVKDQQGVLQLANLQISTSALGSWIEFAAANDLSKIAVQVASFTAKQNGAVHFNSPVYTALPVTPQVDAQAGALQKIVKEYIAEYLAYQTTLPNQEYETQFKSPEPVQVHPSAYQQPSFGAASFGGQPAAPQFGGQPTNTFPTNVTIPPPQQVQHQAAFGGEQVLGNPFETNDAPPF